MSIASTFFGKTLAISSVDWQKTGSKVTNIGETSDFVHGSGRKKYSFFIVRNGTPNKAPKQPRKFNDGAWGQEYEEEIFSITGGWKVNPLTLATEEELTRVGITIPEKMKPKSARKNAKNASKSDLTKLEPQAERLIHKRLRIIAGTQGGRKLLSPADAAVRPMMEVVRGAVFSILQAVTGTFIHLPDRRWLDLYSGTGSVGIEALSRGCTNAHFVELDPWVISNVLTPNLEACSFSPNSVIHNTKVESFLHRAETSGASFAGGAFDYISVTPPYEAVVYTDLMDQLSKSPLIHSETCMIVEYPIKSKAEIPDTCGPLYKIRDRKYGRTFIAVYGPEWALED